MAKMRNKNVRKIENEEEVNSKKTVDTQKSEKTKSKKVTSFGSGEERQRKISEAGFS